MPATTHLEAFGQCLRDAFGAMPYHVGSSIHGKAWRDVDVRIMLDDDRFDALFPGYADYRQRDAWWSLLCAALSELGRQRTGLPLDVQVQKVSEANEKFPGPRNPLFVGHAREEHRPAMVPMQKEADEVITDATDDDRFEIHEWAVEWPIMFGDQAERETYATEAEAREMCVHYGPTAYVTRIDPVKVEL
jgi:hypothetical protein